MLWVLLHFLYVPNIIENFCIHLQAVYAPWGDVPEGLFIMSSHDALLRHAAHHLVEVKLELRHFDEFSPGVEVCHLLCDTFIPIICLSTMLQALVAVASSVAIVL